MPKPTGTVYLCANAVIDNSYSSTIDFKNPSEQYAYWGSLVKYSITGFSYIRRTRQYIRVDKSLNELEDVNYLFFRAEEDNKLYYCFVTSKEYEGDRNTYIYFETDVLQSYMFDYEIKQSYVEQEHVDRWDANHHPIYSRTDEGLNYGSEYTTESAFRVNEPTGVTWYLVLLKPGFNVSSGDSGTNTTYISRVANPYQMMLLPSKYENIRVAVKYNSASDFNYVGSVHDFSEIMAKSDLGNFVHQIIRLPYTPFNVNYDNDGPGTTVDISIDKRFRFGDSVFGTGNGDAGVTFITIQGVFIDDDTVEGAEGFLYNTLAEMGIFEGIESALPTAKQWEEVKTNPYFLERDKRFESKLLCYPYRYNFLTDWKNQPIIIKNEYIGADKIKVNFIQSLTFNGPARYWVEDYRKDLEGRNNSLSQMAQEDVPVITDVYYSYMLQNRNQLQADKTTAMYSGIVNTVMGAVNGASSGSVGGFIGGTLSAGVNAGMNYQALVRNQNAKQSDLKNLPDTLVSSNDTGFTIQDNNKYVCLYRKKICCEFEELLADTFAMTGYTVRRVKVPNLRSRLRYNYVKTIGANIVGSFNQEDLRKIKAIFDQGVTFWHFNDVNFKPFDYSYENIEVTLI